MQVVKRKNVKLINIIKSQHYSARQVFSIMPGWTGLVFIPTLQWIILKYVNFSFLEKWRLKSKKIMSQMGKVNMNFISESQKLELGRLCKV